MKKIILIVTALSLLAFISCGDKNSLEAKKAELETLKAEQASLASKISELQAQIEAAGDINTTENNRSKFVSVNDVTKQAFEHAIITQGKIDGDENITYTSKVPGQITVVRVKSGDRVKAGQVLAEIDNNMVRQNLEALKKQYELVNILFEKRKALWDQKVGSEIEYLQAKNQKETLEKQIAASKEGLDMYFIKADFAGVVDVVSIKAGQLINPGVPAITIINPAALKIKAELSESYLSRLKTGNKVMIYYPDLNESAVATVSHISRTIDPMTRTFKVEINLPSNPNLNPNMVAELRIVDYNNPQTIVVPVNTIQYLDNEQVVFIAVDNGKEKIARKVVVKSGDSYDNKTEIISGLKVGDKLITTGYQDLVDGQSIKF